MAKVEQHPAPKTHEVFNQSTPLENYNVFGEDRALVEALRREGGEWAEDRALQIGEVAGRARTLRWGAEANENTPVLRTHDRFGNRIDEVEFHPAWHELMRIGIGDGLHALPWREPQPGAHVARAAMFITLSQAEAGVGCPISMTYSAIPALRAQPELAEEWEPRFLSLEYDERLVPAPDKTGALCGMAMTEKQGGSDVRANTTVARPLNGGGPGAAYEVTGHKWFCSAPMCDAFLVLAQAEGGLSCFLLPRFTPDGERNGFHIQRLKDKLGNRSNASSEVEFRSAWARLIGEEGRGVPTIIEMVNHTRLDCTIGSTAGMRAGVAHAAHHCSQRSAFGKLLIEQPLMQNVLADLAVESEAATVSAMRLARSFDEETSTPPAPEGAGGSPGLKRLATPVLKYWICKRAPAHAVEALECFGGNGYVEESGMPRLFRESPLSSIWEGSGNVQCLDVLRAMARSPEAVDAFFAEVNEAAGAEPRLDSYAASVREELGDLEAIEARARRVVERMALALQGSLLVRHGDPAVADAFCASRLAGDWSGAFGTLPAGTDFGAIVERHTPRV
ncbi:MAG: acyl-CoA dehydrogenase family protein [Solirubrobacterales bacterium]